jgi:parvulin-like peptidyl-prolyl isomerase
MGRLAVAALCLFLTASACKRKNAGEDPAAVDAVETAKKGTIVLQVEGTAYSSADFEKYLKLNAGLEWKTLDSQALSRLFDNYVQEKLLLARAKARAVVLTDGERSAYLAKLKTASTVNGVDAPPVATIDDAVVAEKLIVEKYLSTLLATLNVDDAAVAEYYDAHKKDFLQPERVQVSQILMETEAKASDLLNRLKGTGEDGFRAAARAESKGLEAPKGGLLGEFSAGQLPPELEKAIFVLKTGEMSRVVESTFGYHIFRLDRRFETRLQTLADATPAIRAQLFDAKSEALIEAHVEELKATMEWKTDTDKLPFPYQRIES